MPRTLNGMQFEFEPVENIERQLNQIRLKMAKKVVKLQQSTSNLMSDVLNNNMDCTDLYLRDIETLEKEISSYYKKIWRYVHNKTSKIKIGE